MTYIGCAGCETRLEPDDTHFFVTAEFRDTQEPADTEEFAFCFECWEEIRNSSHSVGDIA